MNIYFHDPEDIPLPPEEVRIRELRADPWPDGRRVRIDLEVTPFQKRPSGEISILDDQGEEMASISIIETGDPKMEFTIHLRSPRPGAEYTVSSKVYYAEAEEEEDEEAANRSGEKPLLPLPTKIRVVDQAQTTFRIEE
jgi:hypothetical protein